MSERVKQLEIVARLVDESLAENFNLVGGYKDPDRPRHFVALRTGGDFPKKLTSIAPILKSKSFKEEAEWRLVSEKGLHNEKLSFRSGLSTLTPYFKFQLGEKPSYLGSITVGPTPQKELAKDAAELMLNKYRLGQEVTLYETEIPFRNW